MAGTKVISSNNKKYVSGGSASMLGKTGVAAAQPGTIVSKSGMSKTAPHGGSTSMFGKSGSKAAKAL